MKSAAEKYRHSALHYIQNALFAMQRGEASKASEFLWGAMVSAVKAVAASRGIHLKTHRDLWNYVAQLSKAQNDPSLYQAFAVAHNLHANFYEVEFDLQTVALHAQIVREGVARLLTLAQSAEPPVSTEF